MTAPEAAFLATDEQTLKRLLNVGASFAAIHVAIDCFEKGNLDDEDLAGIQSLPQGLRLHTVARLLDCAEAFREELRVLEGYLLLLTGPDGVTES